jgi:hypothetical protein
MESQTSLPKSSHRKIYWIVGGVIFILIIFVLWVLYSVGYIKVRTAYCSIQGKTLVYSCSSLGCDVRSGKCVETAKDYKKVCIQNSECSSGLCRPEGIDAFNDERAPIISSLKEKNPEFISGKCSKVLVSSTCSANEGLPSKIPIQKLEEAYKKLEASPNSLSARMELQGFYGPMYSGDPNNCGTFE